jgi:hypothetical protein
MAVQITEFSNVLYERNQTIEELKDKVKDRTPTTSTSSSRSFNTLNIELNKARKENETLQRKLDELKYTKRQGLSVKQEQNNHNVLSMLQTQFQTPQQVKNEPIPAQFPITVEPEEKENTQPSNSQPSNSDKLDSTQTNEETPNEQTMMEDDENDNNEFLEDSKDQCLATFDLRNSKPIIQESIQLKSRNYDLPSSSPTSNSHDEEENTYELSSSSPIKQRSQKRPDSKREISSSQVIEIEDSQSPHDNHLFGQSLPTPQTNVKRFQTPKLSATTYLSKRSNLQTPDEAETPMKKPKISRKAANQIPTKKLDLSHHPQEHRNWAIEDFKVNPSKNQNVTHAYHVVLRGKSRSCVHGKTCKDCERFYEMAGDLPNFEEWGPQWNDDKSDRKFDIVSKTSRHKELWERPESPPGFGDFDFPTTQEQVELNKKSDLMIRRTAYERLFSALHDKKYIFRDEKFNKLVETDDYKIDENVFLEYLRKQ